MKRHPVRTFPTTPEEHAVNRQRQMTSPNPRHPSISSPPPSQKKPSKSARPTLFPTPNQPSATSASPSSHAATPPTAPASTASPPPTLRSAKNGCLSSQTRMSSRATREKQQSNCPASRRPRRRNTCSKPSSPLPCSRPIPRPLSLAVRTARLCRARRTW